MDLHKDLEKWVRSLGYSGNIPVNLSSICNNSTRFIWEDLMQKFRPKDEVQAIRRQIIQHRLETKPLEEQDHFAYEIKEIKLYKEKQELAKQLNSLKTAIKEKQNKLEKLINGCASKAAAVSMVEQKISEKEQMKHLLDCKRDELKKQMCEAEDMLAKLQIVTPVEHEESSNSSLGITETLQDCALKLEKMLIENQQKRAEQLPKRPRNVQSTTKTTRSEISVAELLARKEEQNFEEIARSCRKQPRVQEDKSIRRRELRSLDSTDSELSGIIPLSIHDGSFKEPPQKRESLGLLPQDCLNDISIFIEADNQMFLSNSRDSSTVLKFDDCFSIWSQMSTKKRPQKMPVEPNTMSELCSNVSVNEPLEKLLHTNNRQILNEKLRAHIEKTYWELVWLFPVEPQQADKGAQVMDCEVAKLRFRHVELELKIQKQEREMKELNAKIGKKKMEFLNSIESRPNCMELEEWLEASLFQRGLEASIEAITKLIRGSQDLEANEKDIEVLVSKIKKIRQDTGNKVQLILWTMDKLRESEKAVASTQELVQNSIWQLRSLNINTQWMDPLVENICSGGLQVFRDFPLAFSRRRSFLEGVSLEEPCKDLWPSYFPISSDLNSKESDLVFQLLENPLNPPEVILLEVKKAKNLLDYLKLSLPKRITSDQEIKKYALQELQAKDSYVQGVVDRLQSLLTSSSVGSTGDWVKEAVEICKEMFFVNLISTKREVEGKGFMFYKRKLDRFI